MQSAVQSLTLCANSARAIKYRSEGQTLVLRSQVGHPCVTLTTCKYTVEAYIKGPFIVDCFLHFQVKSTPGSQSQSMVTRQKDRTLPNVALCSAAVEYKLCDWMRPAAAHGHGQTPLNYFNNIFSISLFFPCFSAFVSSMNYVIKTF